MSQRLPNFFVAGAPKCGTTALYSYLSTHPQAFVPDMKEPCYWSSDLPGHCKVAGRAEYALLYDKAPRFALALGDASPFYLYSDCAVSNIEQDLPDPKYIIMIRNPVEMVHAFHSQLCFNGNEDIDDFEEAFRSQSARRRGERLPRWNADPKLLQYSEVAALGTQVERLLELVEPARVKLLLFDDFRADTRGAYESVLEFLGLQPDGRAEFPRVNESHMHRFPAVGRALHHAPRPLLRANEALKSLLGIKRTYVHRLFARNASRPPIRAAFRIELLREFELEIAKIESLFERDLAHWREVDTP